MSRPAFTRDDVPELAPLKELLRPFVAFYLDLRQARNGPVHPQGPPPCTPGGALRGGGP
ncbi:hypothetical protein G4Z16_29625 [Streptomyces bathyalis]|uniref:Uncharacterized protein n=1 Tax=Streptomyces bathyalis TaxID=2710756 RepID=A0A7T1TBG7_9ACTN|nr:hypothetical protein [Streptomyces bathyalis]QPP09885.1 hypothetical protein G4Z16_29625 [Streptomyces bathyalis]